MPILANISFRRAIGILLAVLAILAGGTWITVRLTTEHLLDTDATTNARDWAKFIAANVTDLEQIANGEQPSSASLAFFVATRKAGQVYRYLIFNREGYSQLVSDRDKIAPVDLSEFNAAAARAGQLGLPVVDIKKGSGPAQPAHFAEAYVPVMVGGRPVAVVAAFVDETEQRDNFFYDFMVAAISLCLLTGAAFCIPAVAWYYRTKEKQQADRRIRFLAHHDALTGLANRARLIERLEGVLAVQSSIGGEIAVHFIDIDHFKEVNDSLGHDGGDFLLNTIGQRLSALTRMEDLVARLGGDEFVVVQTAINSKVEAEEFAQRITSILQEPMYFKEQEIKTNVTIGVALAPSDGKTSERLLKSADLALYSGKAAGRNCIRFFTPDMDEVLRARLTLEKLLREAVALNQFELHYQPMYEISGKKLIGFEALVRLPGPHGELIPPTTFIPIAEEMRLIDRIGKWVLREACQTATTWPKNLTVAVNLSPAEFESGAIVESVAAALKDTGLEAHRLELEIPETLLLGNSERTMVDLKRLKAMGISIVMDDFGTGYSSLSYLWKFPFDKIKIDRSFMESFEKSGGNVETVVKSIIALGREMHMRVTVEGVETLDQVDFLNNADADQVQGFYFGKPVSASAVSADILADFRKSISVMPPAQHAKPQIVARSSSR
jgi:diguanylate cyclase (GGDEF)-like protein